MGINISTSVKASLDSTSSAPQQARIECLSKQTPEVSSFKNRKHKMINMQHEPI